MKQLFVVFVATLATGLVAAPTSKSRGASQLPGLNRPSSSAPAPKVDGADAVSPSITTTLPTLPSDKGITGFVDIRPTFDLSSTDNTSRFETSVGIGYKFSKDVSLILEQPFWSNISTTNAAFNGTLETQAREGHVRLMVRNVLPKVGPLSFGYEARAYYPSRTAWRDNGMVTVLRNIFQVSAQVTPWFSIAFQEQLIYHVYDRSFGASGVNPSFHNRLVLAPELSLLGGKLTVGLPVFFDQVRNRNGDLARAEAVNWVSRGVRQLFPSLREVSVGEALRAQKGLLGGKADAWFYSLWINPEVMYSVTKDVQMGVSYYSGDLVAPDLSSFSIVDGLKSGAPQLALRVTL